MRIAAGVQEAFAAGRLDGDNRASSEPELKMTHLASVVRGGNGGGSSRGRSWAPTFLLLQLLGGWAAAAAAADWNTTCPARCVCHVGLGWSEAAGNLFRTVSCLDGSLGAPPPALPDGAQRLVIVGSALSDLSGLRAAVAGGRLTEIDLSNSELKLGGLQSLATAGGGGVAAVTAELRVLVLNGNRLTSLPGATFGGSLSGLEHLALSDNGLLYMEDDALAGLARLRTLHLQRNKLTAVRAAWFGGLAQLESLDLSDNQIASLPPGAFAGLRNLRSLSLASNRLSTLFGGGGDGGGGPPPPSLTELLAQSNQLRAPPNVSRLEQLKVLRLDANPIVELSPRAFAAPALVELTLADMPRLEAVHAAAFAGCPLLRQLRLNDNPRLAYVDEAAFDGLGELTHLYLHDGALRVLPAAAVRDGAPKLEQLSLYGNPLQCGCHAAWIRRALNATAAEDEAPRSSSTIGRGGAGLRLIDGDKITCGSPQFRSGLTLASLAESDLLGTCAPVVFPLFGGTRTASVGDDVRLACKAVGAVRLSWFGCAGGDARPCNATIATDSAGGGGNASSSSARSSELRLVAARPADDGVYECVATDDRNRSDSAAVHLQVLRSRLYVSVLSATSDSLLVRLSVLRDRRRGYRYSLAYRPAAAPRDAAAAAAPPRIIVAADTGFGVGDGDDAAVQHLTVGDLQPNTTYEVCVVLYSREHPALDERCVAAATRPRRPFTAAARRRVGGGDGSPAVADASSALNLPDGGGGGSERLSGAAIVASACLAAALLAASCIVAFFVRRRALLLGGSGGGARKVVKYQQHHQQQQADDRIVMTTADLLAGRCYNPTTTPLFASNMAFA